MLKIEDWLDLSGIFENICKISHYKRSVNHKYKLKFWKRYQSSLKPSFSKSLKTEMKRYEQSPCEFTCQEIFFFQI